MTTPPALAVRALGKRYEVGARQARPRTLGEALTARVRGAVRGAMRGAARGGARAPTELWALRDVSFDVAPGEAVGVIGHNGAGKSTLLKVLARITEPTTGRAEVRGRVGSLLEVGTGFHPDLTGRENIFLSGAILGMRRREIAAKFDEIVAFAEVEPFIETPVKRFSSGMYLRLAFAVAAHLEPDVLLMDEVLAVGDAAFQQKCLGKMGAVAGEGRTVLFVSHNLEAVQRLCRRTILVDHGTVAADGETDGVVSQYLARGAARGAAGGWIDLAGVRRTGTQRARFAAARYAGGDDAAGGRPYPDGPVDFTLAIDSDAARTVESLAVQLRTRSGIALVNADTVARGVTLRLREGRNHVRLRIASLHLRPGSYSVLLWLARAVGEEFDYVESAFEIEVVPRGEAGYGYTPAARDVVTCQFEVEPLADADASPRPRTAAPGA